jgi:hypothetical protein
MQERDQREEAAGRQINYQDSKKGNRIDWLGNKNDRKT